MFNRNCFQKCKEVCKNRNSKYHKNNKNAIILLCARKDVEKLYTCKIKRKKKEAETKSSVWDLKTA